MKNESFDVISCSREGYSGRLWDLSWWYAPCSSYIIMLFMQIEGRKDMFYLTKLSTHFIYGYMASDIW